MFFSYPGKTKPHPGLMIRDGGVVRGLAVNLTHPLVAEGAREGANGGGGNSYCVQSRIVCSRDFHDLEYWNNS